MKRGFQSAINTDGSSTPQLLKRGHRRSGSFDSGRQLPAKRGKATKQLSLHQFLNPTPRTKVRWSIGSNISIRSSSNSSDVLGVAFGLVPGRLRGSASSDFVKPPRLRPNASPGDTHAART
eukprot:1150842-Pelagomonas_calceolata.AAC.5